MWIFVLAIATMAQPQTTTTQGNGHHADDERRLETERPRNTPVHGQDGSQRTDAPPVERTGPAENRDADGALMPGAPGTNNPAIPDD
ncbi:hypothetical protein PMI04_002300 [Sphingobium sp. AP49]|uniref:hypothetical protein n=1 Tax=Sphingobium sp. AP49 TaxID=1144307 RepID=UPI0009DB6147|nr:hypothetical protein [Sphingobium sp. AP49]WHO39449.1 hypothetical protein PMI04_002300 [Sphingobium sp. AP49]